MSQSVPSRGPSSGGRSSGSPSSGNRSENPSRRFPSTVAGAAVKTLATMEIQEEPAPAWCLDSLEGRLCELSGGPQSSTLTLAFRLILEAQQRGEPVAWVTASDSSFFPPDVSAGGVDLDALAVIRLPNMHASPKAADHLLRSGAFGLVILDLGRWRQLALPVQTRLAGLAKRHRSVLLCLTEKSRQDASLGSLISLRAEGASIAERGASVFEAAGSETSKAETSRVGASKVGISKSAETIQTGTIPRRFMCTLNVLKDKRSGVEWSYREECRAPAGLR